MFITPGSIWRALALWTYHATHTVLHAALGMHLLAMQV